MRWPYEGVAEGGGGGGEVRYKGKLSDTFDPAPVTVVCSGGRKRAPAY